MTLNFREFLLAKTWYFIKSKLNSLDSILGPRSSLRVPGVSFETTDWYWILNQFRQISCIFKIYRVRLNFFVWRETENQKIAVAGSNWATTSNFREFVTPKNLNFYKKEIKFARSLSGTEKFSPYSGSFLRNHELIANCNLAPMIGSKFLIFWRLLRNKIFFFFLNLRRQF